ALSLRDALPILRVARARHQRVADALASGRLLLIAALRHEHVDRLGRAAVVDAAVGRDVRLAQVAEIADARTRGVDLGIGHRAGDLHDLEGEPRGRGERIGADRGAAAPDGEPDRFLHVRPQAGLFAAGERRARLHTGATGRQAAPRGFGI